MKLYNTLTRKVEEATPLDGRAFRLYSCGPTVYNHVHIGNLSAFTVADTLRRVLALTGHGVKHVMNFTDVDDKTINRSKDTYPELDPAEALTKLTRQYEDIFLSDMELIGNDVKPINFIRATDSKTIRDMQQLITELHANDFAYIADDGVYFSIEKYKASGKQYGQLLTLNSENTGSARINNDEYDKDSVHDFALWKTRKGSEPAWDFELDGANLLGRPGWHIECSVMSSSSLGQPFDIHTGGVDLIFPHHENEIAQSTAGKDNPVYARYFVHNAHVMVEGRKMSKSLGNFYTLRDILERGGDPLAFRLMILQSHYRSQTNFTWEGLQSALNRLKSLQAMADLRFQPHDDGADYTEQIQTARQGIQNALENDLHTPEALAELSALQNMLDSSDAGRISTSCQTVFTDFIHWLDLIFGFKLGRSSDITSEQKSLLAERSKARDANDFAKSDAIRAEMASQGVAISDTPQGQVWSRT